MKRNNPFPIHRDSQGHYVNGKYVAAWVSEDTYYKLRLFSVVEQKTSQQIIERALLRELNTEDNDAGLSNVHMNILVERAFEEWKNRKQQLKPGHIKRAWADLIEELRNRLEQNKVHKEHEDEIIERLRKKAKYEKNKAEK